MSEQGTNSVGEAYWAKSLRPVVVDGIPVPPEPGEIAVVLESDHVAILQAYEFTYGNVVREMEVLRKENERFQHDMDKLLYKR